MKKFNVSHNTYKNFKEIEKLPEIGDNYDGRKVIAINEIGMDCEQPFDDNFNYDLYEIVCEDEDVNSAEYIAEYVVPFVSMSASDMSAAAYSLA